MKKSNLFLVLMMALIVMSCSKDETTMSIPQESNAIEFGTYVGRDAQTRAVMDNDKLLATGFGVYASYNNDAVYNDEAMNYMFNQQITHDGANWTYNPLKYWPETIGHKISFFAYAPFGTTTNGIVESSSKSDSGAPKLTFTVNATTAADMVDFVAGVKMNQDKIATVNFVLKHELTRVGFSAKASEELTVTTDDHRTSFINIKTAKLEESNEFFKTAIYTFPKVNEGKGTWSDHGTAFSLDIASVLKKETIKAGASDHYSVDGIKVVGSTSVDLFNQGVANDADKKYLFLIPQPATAITEGTGINVTFTYDIVTLDDKLQNGYSITSAEKTVSIPTSGLFQQGTAYNITFIFGVTEIKVSAEVDSTWAAGTGGDVIVPTLPIS